MQIFVEKESKADGVKEKVERASNIPREILLPKIRNKNNVSRIHLTISVTYI